MIAKDYLGDSVYCEFDGYGFILTTENGCGPSNTIFLEPAVIAALNRYVERVEEFKTARAAQTQTAPSSAQPNQS